MRRPHHFENRKLRTFAAIAILLLAFADLAAISVLKRKFFSSGWPYHNEVYVYDLVSKQRIFKHALSQRSDSAIALSTDGHQIATIEQGILMLTRVP